MRRLLQSKTEQKYVLSVYTHVANIYANLLEQTSFYVRKEFTSHSVCLEHQHGRRLLDVLGHHYGRRDVM